MHRLVPASLMVSVASGLLAFTACSPASSLGSSPSSPAPAPAQSTSVSAAPASPSTAPTAAATGPTLAEPAPASSAPYRKLRGAFEGVPVIAEVYPIRRDGATSTVNIRFVTKDTTRTFRILRSLSDHNPELSDKGTTAPDGLRLIDPAARKAYLPATIGDRECVCSPASNGWTDRYTDVTVSVTFAAPPASRNTIDLLVPGFGTVNDVPLQ